MTDHHAGYVVVLDHSVREDDAQAIINAIKMIRGVIAVEPVVGNAELYIAQETARHDLRSRVMGVLFNRNAPGQLPPRSPSTGPGLTLGDIVG